MSYWKKSVKSAKFQIEQTKKEGSLNKQRFSQILRFLVGGGVGVFAYYLTLYTLTEFAGVWYVISAIVAFVLNYAINFALQKFWTFKNKDTKNVSRQLTLYFGIALGFLLTNTALLYVFVEYVHLGYLVAQLILTFLLTIASFVITRKIFAN